jgi:hypothetical protein
LLAEQAAGLAAVRSLGLDEQNRDNKKDNAAQQVAGVWLFGVITLL